MERLEGAAVEQQQRGTVNMLLLLLIGAAAAVTPENIRIIQQQSAFVAEASLAKSMNRCMLK